MPDFGTELKRRRTSAGMSLTGLAAAVHFTKGYLSKVENGKVRVNRDLAKSCDQALDARGELLALVPENTPRAALQARLPAADLTREPDDAPVVIGTAALAIMGELLKQYRGLARIAAPRLVAPAVRDLALRLQQHLGRRDETVSVLAARAAELAGWIEQEIGDVRAARQWTVQSGELARAAGRDDLVGFAHLRLADIALEAEEHESALAHVVTAGRWFEAGDPWLRGLLAIREARVHALRKDPAGLRAALTSVECMPTGNVGEYGEDSSLDAEVHRAVTEGWALFELGDGSPATSRALQEALETVPMDNPRWRHRVQARLALAQAEAGDVDAASAHVISLADDARVLESATAQLDLRRLRTALGKGNGKKVDEVRALLAEPLGPGRDPARGW
ncbi:XRE family transcriptional regulator [Amycolatopsis balhimycina DSM 5908]|uniref:XRE family transcriptional regulator n=2 Tax=Amycolatopsis balhimycina TaxID=208443 RepID=A0A428VWA4_AMYBA|nr:XRE family transcriptional regulator [Amycolatopsis balhimycina DSM 5908]